MMVKEARPLDVAGNAAGKPSGKACSFVWRKPTLLCGSLVSVTKFRLLKPVVEKMPAVYLLSASQPVFNATLFNKKLMSSSPLKSDPRRRSKVGSVCLKNSSNRGSIDRLKQARVC